MTHNRTLHLKRLFALHLVAVEALSKEGKSTDAKDLDIVFRKFIALSVASFLEAETQRIGADVQLKDKRGGTLLQFMTSFRMNDEDDHPELTDAVDAYLELRTARNNLIHQDLAARTFDNWSTQDVKDKYERALVLLEKFREWAKEFADKQRGRET